MRASTEPLPTSGGTAEPAPRTTLNVPGVFSRGMAALALLGVLASPVVAGVGQVLLADRLGLPGSVATAIAVVAGAAVALVAGLCAAAVGRRVGFYEIAFATLVLVAILLGPVLFSAHRLRATNLALSAWEAQGTLVAVLGLLFTALAAGTFTFTGAS